MYILFQTLYHHSNNSFVISSIYDTCINNMKKHDWKTFTWLNQNSAFAQQKYSALPGLKHTDCITCISWTKDRCFNHHHQFLLQSNLLAYLHNSSACKSTSQCMDVCFYNIHTAPDIQSCNDILKTSEQLLGLACSSKELECTGLIDHQTCNQIWQESEDECDWAKLFFQIIVTKLALSMCKVKAPNVGGRFSPSAARFEKRNQCRYLTAACELDLKIRQTNLSSWAHVSGSITYFPRFPRESKISSSGDRKTLKHQSFVLPPNLPLMSHPVKAWYPRIAAERFCPSLI